jgi:mono/diheme cytochrome c family protein
MEGAEVKPNFQRPPPGGLRGRVVAVVVCAECHAERRGRHGYGPGLELGKVLRDAEGATWVNRRARPDRPPLDAEFVAGLAVSWPPTRLVV